MLSLFLLIPFLLSPLSVGAPEAEVEKDVRALLRAGIFPIPVDENLPEIGLFGEMHSYADDKVTAKKFQNAYSETLRKARAGEILLLKEMKIFEPFDAKNLRDPNKVEISIENEELLNIVELIYFRHSLIETIPQGGREAQIAAFDDFFSYLNSVKSRRVIFEKFRQSGKFYKELKEMVDSFQYSEKQQRYGIQAVDGKKVVLNVNDLFTMEYYLVNQMLKDSKLVTEDFRDVWKLHAQHPQDGDLSNYIFQMYVARFRDRFIAENILVQYVEALRQKVNRPVHVQIGLMHLFGLEEELKRLSGGRAPVKLLWLPGEGESGHKRLYEDMARLRQSLIRRMEKTYGIKTPPWLEN